MDHGRDYYEILGVPKRASLEEIRKAYRQAALRYHPDRVPEKEKRVAEEKFKEISEAYAVLSDPQKRAIYDSQGHVGIDQTYTHEDIFKGADFSSIFEDLAEFGFGASLFEHFFGQKFHPQHSLRATLEISLEEAATGSETSLSLPGDTGCSLKVKIPPGVATGSELRVHRAGGDLLITIRVRPHPLFEREGDDLLTHLTIPLSIALLGGEVKVPTLFGKVIMKIPAGTQNGVRLRLKGKGMPHLQSKKMGDAYFLTTVRIPTSLTHQQRRLIEEFAQTEKNEAP